MFRSVYSVPLCCSVYCLWVNVYCTAESSCRPNCSLQNISYVITGQTVVKRRDTLSLLTATVTVEFTDSLLRQEVHFHNFLTCWHCTRFWNSKNVSNEEWFYMRFLKFAKSNYKLRHIRWLSVYLSVYLGSQSMQFNEFFWALLFFWKSGKEIPVSSKSDQNKR